jgi:hypothetical protein
MLNFLCKLCIKPNQPLIARLELAIWFSKTYNKLFDKNLGDIEIVHIKDVLKNEMEAFK